MRFGHSAAALFLLVCAGLGGARGQTITDFNPKFGSPGEYVTINGSAFYYSGGSIDPVVDVRIGSTFAARNISQDNLITIAVPNGAASGLISVRKSGRDWVYGAQVFTVIGPGPYISGFSPTNGNVGTPVTLQGAHFTGATAVRFNGASAPGFFVAGDTQIQVNAPATVTTGPITVVALLGSHASAANFNVPPSISGFSPASGRTGTNVVITGKNFTGATALYFSGLSALFTVNSLTNITATAPGGVTTGPIMVVAPAGAYPTSSNFVVLPTITGFAPGFGPVGTSVTVSGANFNVGTPSVKFGGVSAAAPTGISFSQLTAIVPAGATNAPITVTTADGSSTSAASFHVPARISGFSPTNSAPDSLVILSGVNFSGASAVTFNGTPAASFGVSNNTTLGAVVPAGVTTGPIAVTTPAGTTNSGALFFYGVPGINSFTPTHGLPGTNVVLSGANFLGASAVRFNGMSASFTPPTNNNTLVATAPSGATPGPITVVAPAGTNTSAGVFTLDYTANLRVTVPGAPNPVFVGSNLVYSVVVLNQGPFAAPDAVLSDTLPASVSLKSATTTLGSLDTNGNPVTASIGTLNVGASATVTLTVAPQVVGWITNLASVSSGHPDPSPTDNTAATPTFVQPLPWLSIWRPQTDRVRVSWPAALSNFTLQYLPAFSATSDWSNVTTTVNSVGEESVVTETNAQPARLYRLKK